MLNESLTVSDKELKYRIVSEDIEAIRLVRSYCEDSARRLLGTDSPEREDLAQDATIQVWKKIGTYDPDKSQLRTWITKIVNNKHLDSLRRKKRRRPTYSLNRMIIGRNREETSLYGIDLLLSKEPDPSRIDEKSEEQRKILSKIEEELEKMPGKQSTKDIYHSRRVLGLNLPQTSILLKRKQGTIKSTVSRIDDHLRQQLSCEAFAYQ